MTCCGRRCGDNTGTDPVWVLSRGGDEASEELHGVWVGKCCGLSWWPVQVLWPSPGRGWLVAAEQECKPVLLA